MHVWDSGPVRQTELIAVLNSDSATVTGMVQRLEKAGSVERTPDPVTGGPHWCPPSPRATPCRQRSSGCGTTWRHRLSATCPGTLAPSLDPLAKIETNLAAAPARS
ncbi:MarR family winged helix-turn-helix transcriptional regulator [Umezawaea beigongshangensis]|uniref:MarR family winged helix-turn-helix transcriptional regulator n=1 Tax=Umezawaea beigongshangensis TaxID=2780383 RepID=UPI0034D49F14